MYICLYLDIENKNIYLGGGFKYFLFSPRTLGKWSNLTSIFFKWVVQPPTRHIYIYTWNPNDLYFWRSTPQNKAFSNQKEGHLGSRYIYMSGNQPRKPFFLLWKGLFPFPRSPFFSFQVFQNPQLEILLELLEAMKFSNKKSTQQFLENVVVVVVVVVAVVVVVVVVVVVANHDFQSKQAR